MEHADGIRTRLRTRDELVHLETENPFGEHGIDGLVGRGTHKLVNIVPGKEIIVSIDFDDRFDLGAADGIRIITSTGRATPRASEFSNAQALWVPASDVKVRAVHISAFRQYNRQGRHDGDKALLAPERFGPTGSDPPRYRIPEMYNSNDWAITIYVQRVYLRRSSKDVVRRYASADGRATIPPECHFDNIGVDSGKQVINPHWVTALDDAKGIPYMFEFVNTAVEVVPVTRAATDSATGVAGMARTAVTRSGVDDGYLASAGDEDDEEMVPIKREQISPPPSPRAETAVQGDAMQGLVPTAATIEVPMAATVAASTAYRWDERAQMADEIRLLELRMKLREMDRPV